MAKENSVTNNQNNKNIIMRNNKKFIEQGADVIFHGIKFHIIKEVLEKDFLEPRTFHRYWKDGLRRKENWKDYEDSYWKSGWSMTREANVALNFGALVFVFDKNKIKQRNKVEPIAWNFHFSDAKDRVREINHKKEAEEFVVSEYTDISLGKIEKRKKEIEEKELPEMYQTYKSLPKETNEEKAVRKKYKEQIKKAEEFLLIKTSKLLDEPIGKNLNISGNCLGFYLDDFTCSIYDGRYDGEIKVENLKVMNELKKHPLFLGMLNENKMFEHFKEKQINAKMKM